MEISYQARSDISDCILFSESSPGVMDIITDSSTYVDCVYSGDRTNTYIAGVMTSPGKVVADWYADSDFGNGYVDTYICAIGITGFIQIRPNASASATSGSLTVINEHGTHIGTPSCSSAKIVGINSYGNSCGTCVGVKHESTEEGWEFTGWNVLSNSYIKNYSTRSYASRTSDSGEYILIPDSGFVTSDPLVFAVTDSSAEIEVVATYKKISDEVKRSGYLIYEKDSLIYHGDSGRLLF